MFIILQFFFLKKKIIVESITCVPFLPHSPLTSSSCHPAPTRPSLHYCLIINCAHVLWKFFGWSLHLQPPLHAKVKPLPLFKPFLFKCKMNHHFSAFLPSMYITKLLFLGESESCLESSTQFSKSFWLTCQICLCEMTSFYISAVTYLWNIFNFNSILW